MKTGRTVVAFAMAVAAASAVRAQDPVKVDPAHYKVVLDNDSVRVLRITYPAGATSKMHQHPDAMVVGLSTGNIQFAMPDGTKQDSPLQADTAMATPATTHLPTNVGKTKMEAILVEFKSAQPGTATIPTERPDMQIKTLAESPRAVAYRATLDSKFQEPAGTKHDYDQVVIALAPSQTSLKVEGQPAKASWKRGDVVFIGRGVAHESKAGPKPSDIVIVAVK
jgi:quercetin dioxygenase-like cupin family protein